LFVQTDRVASTILDFSRSFDRRKSPTEWRSSFDEDRQNREIKKFELLLPAEFLLKVLKAKLELPWNVYLFRWLKWLEE
jgi:hypothetical protein